MFMFVMLFCLFFTALCSPAANGLTSWLSCVLFFFVFVTYLYGVQGQVWYLIVLIPDLCLPLYFEIEGSLSWDSQATLCCVIE